MTGSPASAPLQPLPSRLARAPWLLLTLTMLCWGGNVVAARSATGQISPMALVCFRWLIVCVGILAYTRGNLKPALDTLRPHWPYVSIMGAVGFTASNTFLFVGARYTTGVNIAIIQGVLPVLVLIAARAVYGIRIGPLRMIGVALTFVGIMLVATAGDLLKVGSLEFNKGDFFAFLGAAIYAGYTVALRNRPPIPPFAFFIGLAFAAFLSSLPLVASEIVLQTIVWPTWQGWMVLLYVAIFTSVVGQIFWIRSVEAIGPGRAGIFQNLVPVIGAFLSVLILQENFHWYHAISLALVLSGILVSETLGRG